MARAIWKGAVLAESDRTRWWRATTIFPPPRCKREYLRDSATHTICGWKGVASYYDVVVDGEANRDAAWYYPIQKPRLRNIKDHVAFWRGVQVEV